MWEQNLTPLTITMMSLPYLLFLCIYTCEVCYYGYSLMKSLVQCQNAQPDSSIKIYFTPIFLGSLSLAAPTSSLFCLDSCCKGDKQFTNWSEEVATADYSRSICLHQSCACVCTTSAGQHITNCFSTNYFCCWENCTMRYHVFFFSLCNWVLIYLGKISIDP